MLNYRCLVLDHDDTVVRSEETVNYPSFLEALKVPRPGRDHHAGGIHPLVLLPRLFRPLQRLYRPDARGDRCAVRHVAKLCRHTYPAPL